MTRAGIEPTLVAFRASGLAITPLRPVMVQVPLVMIWIIVIDILSGELSQNTDGFSSELGHTCGNGGTLGHRSRSKW